MAKSTLRSIRFSERSIEIIDSMPGNSFSGRLENLISHYALQRHELETELASLEAKIAQARLKLRIIESISHKLNSIDTATNTAKINIDKLATIISKTEETL